MKLKMSLATLAVAFFFQPAFAKKLQNLKLAGTWTAPDSTFESLCGANANGPEWAKEPRGSKFNYSVTVTEDGNVDVTFTKTPPSGEAKTFHFTATVKQVADALNLSNIKNTDELSGELKERINKALGDRSANYTLNADGKSGELKVANSAICGGGPVSLKMTKTGGPAAGGLKKTGARP